MKSMKRPKLEVKQEVEDNEVEMGMQHEQLKRIKTEELKCDFCTQLCSSISDLQAHTLREHVPLRKGSSTNGSSPPEMRVCCQQCDAVFDSFAQFAVHMSSHLSQVSVASSSGTSTAAADSSSEVLKEALLYCPICPLMTFREPVARLEHITVHHLQVKVPQNVCTSCDVLLTSPSHLSSHYTQFHLRIRFECTSCSFVADNEQSFKEHSKSHVRQTTTYGCQACSCSFRTQQMLLNHVQLCHDQCDSSIFTLNRPPPPPPVIQKPKENNPKSTKIRVLQCSVCDESVVGEDGLDEHRLLRHCKIRYADKCADCQEPIGSEDDFVEHCSRHSADITIHCPICRQSLRSETQIHAHKKYHMVRPLTSFNGNEEEEIGGEPLEYPFVCPYCGEKFHDALKLIEHAKAHDNIEK